MNTLEPLNDVLFPFVLFFTYFCTACIILYNQRQQNSVQPSPDEPQSFTIKEAFSPQFDPEPIEEELPVADETNAQQNGEETLSSEEINSEANREEIVEPVAAIALENSTSTQPNSPSQLNHQAAAIIDKLNKRQLRKLCAPLGIKQKTNGVELTTELIKASVRRKFKENPQQVIAVIRARLPELMPTETPRSQQLTPEAC
ncbi:MAG: hypothetical protein ACRDEA_19560 [Microcystaceae cyanobacterium]